MNLTYAFPFLQSICVYGCLIEIIISVHKQENPMGHMTVFQNQTQNQKGSSWSLLYGSWMLPVESVPVTTKLVSSTGPTI